MGTLMLLSKSVYKIFLDTCMCLYKYLSLCSLLNIVFDLTVISVALLELDLKRDSTICSLFSPVAPSIFGKWP